MSSTFSEIAAAAITDTLGARDAGRYLITDIHGEDLADTFRALLAQANGERLFTPRPGTPTKLKVVDSGNGRVIAPYLVQEPAPAKPRENRGSQGFVSAIRDNYSEAREGDEQVTLLAFAANPNETLLTTMEQGVLERALELQALLARALTPPATATIPLRRVLTELQEFARKRLEGRLQPATVGRAAQASEELSLLDNTDEIASQLYLLPWCLSDPQLFQYAGREFQKRLQDAAGLRQRLERWASDPNTDFDAELRRAYSPEIAEKVSAARTGTAISWGSFTVGDLLGSGPPPPPDDHNPSFAAVPLTVEDATAWKLLNDDRTIAAAVEGPGCALRFNMEQPLRGQATLHLIGYQGDKPPFAPKVIATIGAGEETVLALDKLPQPRLGWSFLQAVLTKGKRVVKAPLDRVHIALSIGAPDGILVYEEDGQVDLEAQAYRGDEVMRFIGERDGSQVFAQEAEPPEAEYGDALRVGDETVVTVPAVQAEAIESGEAQAFASPEHLAIEAWSSGALPPGPLNASIRSRPGGEVVADIGTMSRPIEGAGSLPLSRWQLERHAIEHPRTTAFVVGKEGALAPNENIEQLALGELGPAFEKFLQAREAFFAELAALSVPSVLAADLSSSAAATAYVEAYDRLLAAVPDQQPGQLGHDRLLLADSFITAEGELLIAPTSPPSVALHQHFQARTREWLAEAPAANYFPGDAELVSPQNLIPYLRFHTVGSEWQESGYAPYPWRRYLPFSERARQERHPSLHRYISRRIERFLDVHPSYADERRVLRLAFINPGSGAHIRDALLHLVTPYLRGAGDRLLRLPALDLQLLGDDPADGSLGTELDLFMELIPEEGQPSDAAMEVMKRLSYTKGSTAEYLSKPTAFAHIAFVEGFFQPRTDLVEWPGDAHPSSMYVEGIAADTERLASTEPGATRFLTAAWTGGAAQGAVARIAARTTEMAAAAAGVPVKAGIVRAADVFVPDSQIPQLYERATWVVHIDRHIGLELFSPQDPESSSPYILDYTDQETPEPGVFDGITATSQVSPYTARIAEVLGNAVGTVVPVAAAERLLRTLNLISGRWGLEMLRTTDNVLRGRLATALAAQVLEQAEALHSDPSTLTLVIALDELLRVTGGEGLALKHGWAAKASLKGGAADDLLLLTVPLGPERPQLQGRIVEVKYRSTVGASAQTAAEQLKATHTLLTELLASEAQPGRAFQGRHLAKLILRYAGRHVAYGLRSSTPAVSAGTEALSRIAVGDYDLDFSIHRSERALCGDYVSVEPSLTDTSLTPQSVSVAETEIGRIRIGAPVIEAILATGSIPATAAHTPSAQAEPSSPPEHAAEGTEPGQPGAGGSDTPPPDEGDQGSNGEPEPPQRPGPNGAEGSLVPSFEVAESELRELGGRLDDVLTSYNLPLQPVEPKQAVCGPNTIRFRVRMARGGTIAQVEARERDIMRELGLAKQLMIDQEAGFVTLDVPRSEPVTVTFTSLAPALNQRPRSRGELPVVFGVDVAGRPRTEDLAQLPHLLIAGSTNSGKSVFLSSILASLVRIPQGEVEIVLIDVKDLDFAPYAAIPQLRQPPISNPDEALEVLDELYATERDRRHKVLADAGAQSILDYFRRLGGQDLSQIVIVIDEFSNLLGGDKATGSKLEDTIQQYAEIMRSFGVYLVIATQRPSADIVTGRIKANLPARCAFRLPTHNDSMTILGRKGAEQLLGHGDMLFYRDGVIERLQAPLTTAEDVLPKPG